MRPRWLRVLWAVAAAAALAGTFTAGVLVGAAGSPAAAPRWPADPLADAASQISADALAPVSRAALDAAAIQAMLRAAGDEWGTWTAVQPTDPAAGYVGVGVWLRADPAGRVLVAQVTAGSSAARSGVQQGDLVRAVAGRSTRGASAPVVAAELRGPAGTSVTVLLQRGSQLRSVRLDRTPVPPPGIRVVLEHAAAGTQPVARVAVPVFSASTGRDVRAVVGELRAQHVVGIVLDLRGNPGGLLDAAVETASVWLSGGPVVTVLRRTGPPGLLVAPAGGDLRTPLVVLVDGGTASAAEVVAGALQDRGRAVLVGSRTFGKGTVQEPRTLTDGSSLELTVARYRTPAGRSPEGVGLAPDIEVPAGSPPELAERRAVEVLAGLRADTQPVAVGSG